MQLLRLWRRARTVVPTGISTAGESPARASIKRRLTQILDAEILRLFPPSADVMAEILAPVANSQKLLTIVLRPDTSVGLHVLQWADQGIIGRVFQTTKPFSGPVRRDRGEVPHLRNTQSVLVMPVLGRDHRVLGIINVESPQPDTFHQDYVDRLAVSGVFDRVAAILEEMSPYPLSNETAVEQLISDTEDSVFTILDPENITGAYYQMLQLAAQIIDQRDLAGGILLCDEATPLVREQVGRLDQQWVTVTVTLGDVHPTRTEWRLSKGDSIGRAIVTQAPIIESVNPPDAVDFLSDGRFASGSTAIMPLLDAGRSIGVIVLYSTAPQAFSAVDVSRLERLAQILVLAIKRMNEVSAARQASQQLAYALTIQGIVTQLFDTPLLSATEVEHTRREALYTVLDQALHHTESHLGMVLLASQTKDPEQLVIRAIRGQLGIGTSDAFDAFVAPIGVLGDTYLSGRPQVIADISTVNGGAVAAFEGGQSLLAVPLKRGGATLGVLELESDRLHHFTIEHLQWALFLADQAVTALTAIDLATEKYRDQVMAKLAKDVDSGIAELRRLSLDQLRDRRNALLQHIVDTVRDLTNATVGRVLVAINVASNPAASIEDSQSADDIDLENGQLLHLIESPTMPSGDPHYFSVTLGLSGIVFRDQRHQVFNFLQQRPAAFYTDPGEPEDIQSGVYVPLFEGTTKIGVFQLESVAPGVFTKDIVALGWSAAELASKVILSARLRLQQLQTSTLRDFDLDILQTQTPDIGAYMTRVLEAAARLTELGDGWGQIIQVRQSRQHTVRTARIESVHSAEVRNHHATPIAAAPFVATFSLDNPLVEDYPLYSSVLATGLPHVVLDTHRQHERYRQEFPWPEAQSIICIPLTRPVEGGKPGQTEVFGLLALASPQLCDFSDADKEVLTLFTQTINLGWLSLTLLNARKELMREITHILTKVLFPLLPRLDHLAENGLDVASVDPSQVHTINAQITVVNGLVTLLRDLMYWFRDLADEDPLQQEPATFVEVSDLVDEMREPISMLANIMTGREVQWEVPKEPLLVRGGEIRQSKIKAALFNYIENALKYGREYDVTVSIAADLDRVRFTVHSVGDQLDLSEYEMIFTLNYRGLNISGIGGTGIGLYQVKRIAQELGGDVSYAPVGARGNDFILWIPAPTALEAPDVYPAR